MKLCKDEYDDILANLKSTIANSEYSMREICDITSRYDPPESIHHSNISQILNQKGRKNLYLQQLLVILKILHIPLENFMFGNESAKLLRRFRKLTPEKRAQLFVYIKNLED